MSILEDLTSGDPHRIWSGAHAVRTLREPEELAELAKNISKIRRRTRGVDLGGAFYPNVGHLEFALQKLMFIRDRKGCLCYLYTQNMFYDPEREQEAGHVKIFQEVVLAPYEEDYVCRCLYCGQGFEVERREYHYPWWSWRFIR